MSLSDVHVAVTNDQGFYSLPNVTSGSYYLKVVKLNMCET